MRTQDDRDDHDVMRCPYCRAMRGRLFQAHLVDTLKGPIIYPAPAPRIAKVLDSAWPACGFSLEFRGTLRTTWASMVWEDDNPIPRPTLDQFQDLVTSVKPPPPRPRSRRRRGSPAAPGGSYAGGWSC